MQKSKLYLYIGFFSLSLVFGCGKEQQSQQKGFQQDSLTKELEARYRQGDGLNQDLFEEDLSSLSQVCEQDDECMVYEDISRPCSYKSYVGVLKQEEGVLKKMRQAYLNILNEGEGMACTLEWSPSYEIKNWRVSCAESRCVAKYLEVPIEIIEE